jgi:hypothetical protein
MIRGRFYENFIFFWHEHILSSFIEFASQTGKISQKNMKIFYEIFFDFLSFFSDDF